MLELFPERTLDNSIHTAIWLGLLVSWSFTERFGWVFAGFVVPGYLAALAVVHPLSMFATIAEAVLTWAGVWVLGVLAARIGLWNVVFGRERFLMFVLLSIPARLLVEGLAAPTMQGWLRPMSDAPAWAGGQFYSIGLVLVPLLANAFWKTGLSVGALQVGTSTALTWLVLTGVIMPFTNYELTRFELSFEGIALDFLYAPKTYLVLVVTALVAARNNVRYGWDFNGILVPSLLALVLATPVKFAATFVEVAVLVVMFRTFLRIPVVSRLNLEGPRRLVTMFSLAYLLKAVVAHTIEPLAPTWVFSDWLGFGYLLTSLAAVKCVQTGRPVGTLVTIGITAVQGWVLASVIAVGLVLMRPSAVTADRAELAVGGPAAREVLRSAARVATLAPDRAPTEQERLAMRAVQVLAGDRSASTAAARRWQQGGGRVQPLQDGCTGVWRDRTTVAPPLPLPSAVACRDSGPWALVPHPVAEPGSLITAAWLLEEGVVAGVAVAGLDPEGVVAPEPTLRLRAALGDREVWWVRGAASGVGRFSPHLSGAGSVPAPLRARLPELALAFDPSPPWGGRDDATLTLTRADLDRVLPPVPVGPVGVRDVETIAAWAPLVRGIVREGPARRWQWAAALLGGGLDGEDWSTPIGPIRVRADGGATVVLAEDAPGLAVVAERVAEVTEARVLVRAEASGAARPEDLLLLAALRGVGSGARLVWVREASRTVEEGPDLWATDLRTHPGQPPTLDDALAEALVPWGGPTWDDGERLDAPWDGGLWGLRFWAAVAPGRALALHVAPRRLVEADGHPDKERLLTWAVGRGIALGGAPAPLDQPAEHPAGAALQQLAARPSDAALRGVSGRLQLVDHHTHVEWWSTGPGARCRATAAWHACEVAP